MFNQKTPELLRPENDDPELAAALQKLAEIELDCQASKRAVEGFNKAKQLQTANAVSIESLLESDGWRDASETATETEIANNFEHLGLKDSRLRKFREAQQRKVGEVRVAANSRLIKSQGLPEQYKEILRKMKTTLAAAGAACEEEKQFRDKLATAGYDFTGEIPPAPWLLPIGIAEDENSNFSVWLRETERDHGRIK